MSSLTITLFDFDPITGQPKEPITAELAYDPELSLEEQGYKKVSIYIGDNVGGGSVMVPLAMLTSAMATVMDADQARTSGIIMPRKGLIRLDS